MSKTGVSSPRDPGLLTPLSGTIHFGQNCRILVNNAQYKRGKGGFLIGSGVKRWFLVVLAIAIAKVKKPG